MKNEKITFEYYINGRIKGYSDINVSFCSSFGIKCFILNFFYFCSRIYGMNKKQQKNQDDVVNKIFKSNADKQPEKILNRMRVHLVFSCSLFKMLSIYGNIVVRFRKNCK